MNGEERELVLLFIPRIGPGTSISFVYSGSTVTPLARLLGGITGMKFHIVFKNGPRLLPGPWLQRND